MTSKCEKRTNRLRAAVYSLKERRDRAEEEYKTSKFRYNGKVKDANEAAASYKAKKEMNEIREESIDILNSIAGLYEKHSIRRRLELILQKISECIFGQSDFRFKFIKKTIRNQQELHIYKVKRKSDQDFLIPISNVGGGANDIVDIVIRILLLKNFPEHQRTLFLDEPMKHLSKDLRVEFFKFVKGLCEDFKIQILMITHESEYSELLDKTFQFTHDGKTTTVKEI